MKKSLFILFLLFLVFPKMIAGDRTEQQMRESAAKVLNRNTRRAASNRELKEYLSLSKLRIYGYDEGGFAIVTTDDQFNDIIGYSTTAFKDSMPCGFRWWLETANSVMQQGNGHISTKASRRSLGSVSPLLTTKWGQQRPFNDELIYTQNGKKYTFVTGCIATALAQVMNYYKYPTSGEGSYSYNVNYNNNAFTITFSADFGNSVYDWDNMLDSYESYVGTSTTDVHTQAVAKLMKDCGVAVHMRYSDATHGSSAFLSDAANALKTYFKYDDSTQFYDRTNYGEEEWMNLIFNEIDKGRPVLYAGADENGNNGHAFILHGYDSTGKIYINWGWYGSYDGYFDLDFLTPDKYQLSYGQYMVITKPGNNIEDAQFHTLTITANGKGSVSLDNENGSEVRDGTKTFNLKDGGKTKLVFSPDDGCKIKYVKVNGTDVTSNVIENSYTIENINNDTTVDVEFKEDDSGLNIRQFISAAYIGGSISRSDDLINTGSQLKWRFSNNSSVSVTLRSMQLIDGKTGAEGNIMSVGDEVVEANSSVAYITTLGSGMHIPLTCRFRYEYNGASYTADAVYGETQSYTLTLKSTGNGSVTYNGNSIREKTSTFDINKGSSATLTFTPDNGYRTKSVIVNGTDVTSQVTNNQYIINNINTNTTVEVEFEAAQSDYDITKYISATSTGGTVIQTNDLITSGSKLNWQFSNESTKKVILNSMQLIDGSTGNAGNLMAVNQEVDANSSVSYTTTIGAAGIHTPVTCRFRYTYNGSEYYTDAKYTGSQSQSFTLSIKATGNGQVGYKGNTIRNTTKTYSVDRFDSATLTITPDDGYQIKSVKLNNSDITSQVSNNNYTISMITSNQAIEVEFEAIPIITYTLSITVSGNGSVSYNGTSVRSQTNAFTVEKGSSVTIFFAPDTDYKIKSVKVDNSDVTSSVSDNQYTISSISADTSVEVEFVYSGESLINEIDELMAQLEEKFITTSTKLEELGGVADKNINNNISLLAFYNDRIDDYRVRRRAIDIQIAAYKTFIPELKNKVSAGQINENDLKEYINGIKTCITNLDSLLNDISADYELLINCPTLTIKTTGNGYASYDETTIRNSMISFTLVKGSSVWISFSPEKGYRIKSVLLNNSDVTSSISNNQYKIADINENVMLEVEFEVITYILTYFVDGEIYKTVSYDYGATITPEAEPTKDGYTFSGWSEIPEMMPDHDVTVTGTFVRVYNVGDVVNVINFIMNANAQAADIALYDMNNDNELNIGDIILIVKWILNNAGNDNSSARRRAGEIIDIRHYTAAQFEIKLPVNNKVHDIHLVNPMKNTHQIMYKQLDEQTYAVVVYSLSNQLMVPDHNNIIEIETEGTSSQSLTIQNVTFAKPDGEIASYDGLFVSTGIDQSVQNNESPAIIYDLKGNRLDNGKSQKKGVYIINGKKVAVK